MTELHREDKIGSKYDIDTNAKTYAELIVEGFRPSENETVNLLGHIYQTMVDLGIPIENPYAVEQITAWTEKLLNAANTDFANHTSTEKPADDIKLITCTPEQIEQFHQMIGKMKLRVKRALTIEPSILAGLYHEEIQAVLEEVGITDYRSQLINQAQTKICERITDLLKHLLNIRAARDMNNRDRTKMLTGTLRKHGFEDPNGEIPPTFVRRPKRKRERERTRPRNTTRPAQTNRDTHNNHASSHVRTGNRQRKQGGRPRA